MRLTCLLLVTNLLLSTAVHAQDNNRTRYLQLVNRANDSVTALAIARAGDSSFKSLPLARALRGGGTSTTIAVASAGCSHDLRLQFDNGRKVLYSKVDLCRHGHLRIGRLPRLAQSQQTLLGSR